MTAEQGATLGEGLGKGFRKPAPEAMAGLLARLQARFGNRFTTSAATRAQHANTVTGAENQPPDAVVFAQSTEEVAEIVRACAQIGAPVIAFGTGTSLEGQINAPFGGVCIDLSQMAAIKAVNAEDLDCVVEPGVTRKALNAHLRDLGLFFPIDPGADASLGGMASTRASGTNAVRYGTMKDAVLGLTAVTATGEIVRSGGRARKSAAGYDLTRLFVGAEGTLGIITELTLKLAGLPEAVSGGVCPFPSVRAACDAVIMTIQTGLPVARIELLDAAQVKAVNAYSKLTLAETPTLFLEFHGTDASVKEQSERFGEIAESFGGGPFDWATNPEDRTRLWQARHDAYWAAVALRPGAKGLSTDVCVPISRLADCVEATEKDIVEFGLISPIVGHVGDGNFHCLPLFDPENAEEMGRVKAFVRRLVERAVAMGGTCTGEHGVGQGKAGYLPLEFPPGTLAMMRAIKAAVDPRGIMNPGKIV
jgi:D-lactate dehydrogenase (cytochrome)